MAPNTAAALETAPVDINRRYPISTGLSILSTSRATFYAAVKAGRIKILKQGRRSYISGQELARLSSVSDAEVA
jgi:hypothetical protein